VPADGINSNQSEELSQVIAHLDEQRHESVVAGNLGEGERDQIERHCHNRFGDARGAAIRLLE
jgi:hypothetical protein